MTVLLGKDGQPIASEKRIEELEGQLDELLSRDKIYRLHPDVAMLCQQIVSLSMMSAGISAMETINAGKTMCEIMLVESKDDPTGTTMTVDPNWYEEFKQNMEGAFAVVEKHLAENREAQEKSASEEEVGPF